MKEELTINDFMQDIQKNQQKEKSEWEQIFESCRVFIDTYEKELNDKVKPELARLDVMQGTISDYIQTYVKRDQPHEHDYNAIELADRKTNFEQYTKWKNELIDINLSNCNSLLKRIETRIDRLRNTPTPPPLSTTGQQKAEPQTARNQRETVLNRLVRQYGQVPRSYGFAG